MLARAGVGTIGIADDDVVDVSNLHRQILFDDADVGRPKIAAAAEAIARLAPGVRIERHETRLLPSNAIDLVSRYDVVLEGSDNFATKFLTADTCRIAGRGAVHASAVRWHGTALAVSRTGAPCYRCLFEDVPREDVPNCAEAGVIGPMVGVVGAAAADLALGLLLGRDVSGTLVTFDGRSLTARRRRIAARSGCALCSDAPTIRDVRADDASRYVPPSCDI